MKKLISVIILMVMLLSVCAQASYAWFIPLPNDWYTDVEPVHDWFFNSVKYVTDYSLMVGTSDTKFSPDEYFVEALNKLDDNSSIIEKKGLFYSLCSEFDKTAKYIDRKNDDKDLLYQIFKFVESNYNKDCSLISLTDTTGFSYSYLSRYFKRVVGISFNDYVNQYRISNACYLLSNSDCSILQCALECGYNSLRSFNRNFVTRLAVTPNEYRNSLKE